MSYRGSQPIPKEGSKIRSIYNRLIANKCRPVDLREFVTKNGTLTSAIDQLKDIYNLDIVKCSEKCHWKVVGIYDPKGGYKSFRQEIVDAS